MSVPHLEALLEDGVSVVDSGFAIHLASSEVSKGKALLRVLKFSSSFTIEVQNGGWRFDFDASIKLFGLAKLDGRGYLDSKGNFSVSLSGQLWIGESDFGLGGHFNIHMSSENLTDHAGNPYYRFTLGGGASAEVRAFGLTVAGLWVGFDVGIEGYGRKKVELRATVKVTIGY